MFFHLRLVVGCVEMNEHKIITGSSDCTLKSWSMLTGRCSATFAGHKGEVVINPFLLRVSFELSTFFWSVCLHDCSLVLCCFQQWSRSFWCLRLNRSHLVTQRSIQPHLILFCSFPLYFRQKDYHWVTSFRGLGDLMFTMFGHVGIVRLLHLDRDKVVSGGDRRKIIVWNWMVFEVVKLLSVACRRRGSRSFWAPWCRALFVSR